MMWRWFRNLRGPGIKNTPNGPTFLPPQVPTVAGASGDRSKLQPCLLVQNGGGNGTDTTNVSYTYDLFSISDTDHANALNMDGPVTPVGPPRWPTTPYTAATRGVYYVDPDGSIQLFLWDEAPGYDACTP